MLGVRNPAMSRGRPGKSCVLAVAVIGPAALFFPPPLTLAQQPEPGPRITFTKILKGSVPEFEQVTVDPTGAATCDTRKLSEPPTPRAFKLSPGTTHKIFLLAGRLHNFQGIDLEAHKSVADLGRKTFAYEHGGENHSAEFNYTTNRDAQDLAETFEGIVSVNIHVQTLEYSIRYDPLGLPRELSLIQTDLERKALRDPELMTPELRAIARDSRFLHVAQVRAENILQRLQQDRN